MTHFPKGPNQGRALVGPVILAAGLLLTAGLAYERFLRGQPALQDFLALQERGPLPAIRPPFYRPLAGLPLRSAAGLWLSLNVAAGLGFGLWAGRRTREPTLALLLAVFVPSIVALSVGQDSLLLVAALAGVFVLLESRRTWTAGLLLSLLWVKFQFLPAFILLLAIRREWRALGGLALGTAAFLAPVAPQLPGYIAYLAKMAAHPSVVPCRRCMPNLHALIPHPLLSLAASAALLAVSAPSFRGSLPSPFALASVCALLASHHAQVYDCVLLFLAAVVRMGGDPAPRMAWAWALGISPLPYLLPYLWAPAQMLPAFTAIAAWVAAMRPALLQERDR